MSDIFLFLDFLLIHFIGDHLILLLMVNYEPSSTHGHMDIHNSMYFWERIRIYLDALQGVVIEENYDFLSTPI